MSLRELFQLSPHGADTFVGEAHPYHWGGLYGGHIVAQALHAAHHTVQDGLQVHSLRAYFIRRGDNTEPIRYEVDRIRNGRSFSTRRVVARQATGAILNLEASFQVHEESAAQTTVMMPAGLPDPDTLTNESWSPYFERCSVPAQVWGSSHRDGAGRSGGWFRVTEDLGDDEIINRCALSYISDDLPTEAVINAVPSLQGAAEENTLFSASLDHTVWFHRPVRASQWHFYEMSCQTYIGGRGLTFGYVFADDGTHIATTAQEVLVRRRTP